MIAILDACPRPNSSRKTGRNAIFGNRIEEGHQRIEEMPDAGNDPRAEPDDHAGDGAEHESGRYPIKAGRQRDEQLAR